MKNLEYVIKKTAKEMNIPEDKVKIIVEGYWKNISDKLVNGLPDNATTIFLRNIGLFTVSRFKLKNYIRQNIKRIKAIIQSNKFTQEIRNIYIEKYRKKLSISLIYRNLIAKQYFQDKQKLKLKKSEIIK